MPVVEAHPDARAELIDAAAWYEEREPSLGADFFDRVLRVFRGLESADVEGSPVPHVPSRLGARRVHVSRFPYQVVYVERADVRRVVAVAHLRRRPGYWRPRIAK